MSRKQKLLDLAAALVAIANEPDSDPDDVGKVIDAANDLEESVLACAINMLYHDIKSDVDFHISWYAAERGELVEHLVGGSITSGPNYSRVRHRLSLLGIHTESTNTGGSYVRLCFLLDKKPEVSLLMNEQVLNEKEEFIFHQVVRFFDTLKARESTVRE